MKGAKTNNKGEDIHNPIDNDKKLRNKYEIYAFLGFICFIVVFLGAVYFLK